MAPCPSVCRCYAALRCCSRECSRQTWFRPRSGTRPRRRGRRPWRRGRSRRRSGAARPARRRRRRTQRLRRRRRRLGGRRGRPRAVGRGRRGLPMELKGRRTWRPPVRKTIRRPGVRAQRKLRRRQQRSESSCRRRGANRGSSGKKVEEGECEAMRHRPLVHPCYSGCWWVARTSHPCNQSFASHQNSASLPRGELFFDANNTLHERRTQGQATPSRLA